MAGKRSGAAKAPKSGKPVKRGRGRGKSEDMTGAKADTVEMRTAGEFDLQQVVIDDGDFDLHFKAAKSAKEMAEKYQSLYRGQLKSAKKVSNELHDSVKLAMSLESKDPAEIKRDLEVHGYVLKRQGCPIQLSIHDTLMGDVKDGAEKRGRMDAVAGRAANCPYPENSDLKALYMKGHQAGIMDNMNMSDEDRAKILAANGEGPGDEDDQGIEDEVGDTEFGEDGAPVVPQSATSQADAGLH